METASGVELQQFRNWYSQAGTPTLFVETEFDESAKALRLRVSQTTKTHSHNKPFHIPLAVGLLGVDGQTCGTAIKRA